MKRSCYILAVVSSFLSLVFIPAFAATLPPPNVIGISINPTSITAEQSATFSATTDRAASKVTLTFTDIANANIDMKPNNAKTGWSIAVPINNAGNRPFKITAYDQSNKSGNTKSGTIPVNKKPDTTKPTVSSYSLSDTSIPLGGSITINYTVADSGGAGLKQVELWRSPDFKNWTEVTGQRRSLSGNGPTSGSFSDTPPAVGTYYYGVNPVDNAGNRGSEGGAKSVTVTSTKVAVTLTVANNQYKIFSGGTATINAKGTNGENINIVADKTSGVSIKKLLSDASGASYLLTGITPGQYKLSTVSVNSTKIESNNVTVTIVSPEGLSSQTGYKWPTNGSVRAKIAGAASVSVSSGQSQICSDCSVYLTDVSGPTNDKTEADRKDGTGILNAFKANAAWIRYAKWMQANPKTTAAQRTQFINSGIDITQPMIGKSIIQSMVTAYDAKPVAGVDARKNLLINQLASTAYPPDQKKRLADVISADTSDIVPSDNGNAILQRLKVNKQCIEWAETTAHAAGGNWAGYSAKTVPENEVTPGMGLYKTGVHAMLVVDVTYDKNGNPFSYKIVDSNYGPGWHNPDGDEPWARKIRSGQISKTTTDRYKWSELKVVRYENEPVLVGTPR